MPSAFSVVLCGSIASMMTAVPAAAQIKDPPPSTSTTQEVAQSGVRLRDHFVFTLSGRVRAESIGYFGPPADVTPPDAARYTFVGTQLRAGIRATFSHAQAVVELQDTRLAGLPVDASLGSPLGNLGPGAIYFAHARERAIGSTFVKQAFLTLRHSGLAATVGRFEYGDGLETVPSPSTLAWLKRNRLGERLIGPFGYTHVTRSFDGARLAYDRPRWNVTATATRPTRGGYEVRANGGLSDVRLAGAALTIKGVGEYMPSDVRLFHLYYKDDRGLLKVDNRPLAIRNRDRDPVRVHTFGGHLATSAAAGPGTLDGLVWLVGQRGEWGETAHSAWAYALEGGFQWLRIPASPWLRGGINRSSGDDTPADRRHETFFQVIPTPRIYAQFPFYNLMNSDDRFVQLILRPHQRVTVRSDFHRLRLTEAADLWYSGGGATSQQVFGFAGTPSGGRHSLARVIDASTTISLTAKVTISGYYARASGGPVVATTFPRRRARFGYVELTFRR